MVDNTLMSPSDIKNTNRIKLVDSKIFAYAILHDKRIAYVKEDSTVEIRDPKQDHKIVASSKPYFTNPLSGEQGILCELTNGNLITNFGNYESDEFVVFTIEKDSIYKVGVIKNIKAKFSKDLIPLSKNRFAVGKYKELSIWKGDVPFQNEPLKSIQFDELYIEKILKLEGKEILVIRFEKLIKLVNLEDYSIMYSFELPLYYGCVFFQYDEDRLVDNKYLINIKTKSFETIFDTEKDFYFSNGIKLSNGYLYIHSYYRYEKDFSNESEHYLLVIDVNTKNNTIYYGFQDDGQMNAIDDHTFVKLDERSNDSIDYCTY